jgi:hypothetical protein
LPSVAVGARHINDDSLWLVGFFLVEGGEGAEQEVAGEGHDGGAARGDAILGLESSRRERNSLIGTADLSSSEQGTGIRFFAILGLVATRKRAQAGMPVSPIRR